MGRPSLEKRFLMIFGPLLGDSGEALGDRGGTRSPQNHLQMPPQRLIEDPLVAKRWPGQPGQDFGRKKAYFQGAWQDQMWLKHSKYCSLLTVRILNFRGLQESILEAILGPFWHHFGIIWSSWGTLGTPSGHPSGHSGVPEEVSEMLARNC